MTDFESTAPAWNCVDYPNEGMHYVNKDGECNWCGKTKEQIKREDAEPKACKLDGCDCHLV